jgi:TRAP-type C4-dicarboxylate transport system permease small subunit
MEITGTNWFAKFRKSIYSISSWSEWVGLVAIAAMVLATLIDVVGSKWFQWPLPGSTEITGVLQVVAIAGGLAFSKIDGRQIRVEFFIDNLPRRGKAAFEVFSSILGFGLFAVAGWMTYQFGLSLFSSGTETLLLGVPLYPFAFWIAFCCIPMACVIIIELVNSIDRILR